MLARVFINLYYAIGALGIVILVISSLNKRLFDFTVFNILL
ncbi:unnamed protein product [marine sediment metagenome]|uniref:Uncharacterized protein n=1 Tax=marine sediment metagenome TaxID=412755 RepID=X1BEP9_9ZZZZ